MPRGGTAFVASALRFLLLLVIPSGFGAAQQDLPPPSSPPLPAGGSNATISSAAELVGLLARLQPPVTLNVTGDLLFNSSNWPDPIDWPGGNGSGSNATRGSAQLVLTLVGQPIPFPFPGPFPGNGGPCNESGSDGSEPPPPPFRLPRVDLSNMQGRLHLAAGSVLILRNLEISGTTLGTWVQHETLEFVSESSGATLLFDSCLLHNTVCPSPTDLIGGYTSLPRAAAYPGDQFVQHLPNDTWCQRPPPPPPGQLPPTEGNPVWEPPPGSNSSAVPGGSGGGGGPFGPLTGGPFGGPPGGGPFGDPDATCYSPAVQLMDVANTLPDFGQVGGYTVVLRNTTLLCDSAVTSNCTQASTERDCFLNLLDKVDRGTTAPIVLNSAVVQFPDGGSGLGGPPVGGAATQPDPAGGGSGGDGDGGDGGGGSDRVSLVAGVSGALGGVGGLVLVGVLAWVLVRRRRLRGAKGLPGCFDLHTDSCRLDALQEALRCGGGDCTGRGDDVSADGSKAPRSGPHAKGASAGVGAAAGRQRLIGSDGKVRTSSQAGSSESNAVTATACSTCRPDRAASGHGAGAATSGASNAASGASGAVGAGAAAAGVGVGGLLEQQRQLNAPTDIRLSVLLGAGSFGRVYSGMWRGQPCAVKILIHGPAETPVIERELQVSLACRHPHVVRTMHFVRLDVTGAAAKLQQARGGGWPAAGAAASGTSGHGEGQGEDMFPTPGRSSGATTGRGDMYETWLIQELCDGGALSSALYGGRFVNAVPDGGTRAMGGGRTTRPHVDMRAILSLALDISRGMAYLHSRGIVHGDLKAENVLLVTRSRATVDVPARPEAAGRAAATLTPPPPLPPQQTAAAGADGDRITSAGSATSSSVSSSSSPPSSVPNAGAEAEAGAEADDDVGSRVAHCRYVAKVADFGLSRALDPGRTHQTTRNVGTITHMPPESLNGGHMRLATDVYAFGVLMWELVTGSRPYSGLTAGEVVHRVVAQAARPAFPRSTPAAWQDLAAECWAQQPERRPTFELVERRLAGLLVEAARGAAAVGHEDVAAAAQRRRLPVAQPSSNHRGANANGAGGGDGAGCPAAAAPVAGGAAAGAAAAGEAAADIATAAGSEPTVSSRGATADAAADAVAAAVSGAAVAAVVQVDDSAAATASAAPGSFAAAAAAPPPPPPPPAGVAAAALSGGAVGGEGAADLV